MHYIYRGLVKDVYQTSVFKIRKNFIDTYDDFFVISGKNSHEFFELEEIY